MKMKRNTTEQPTEEVCPFTAGGNLACAQNTNPPSPVVQSSPIPTQTCLYSRSPPCEHEEADDHMHVEQDSLVLRHTNRDSAGRSGSDGSMMSGEPYLWFSSSVRTSDSSDLEWNPGLRSLQCCSICRFLLEDIGCEETKQFWLSINEEGPDSTQSCHIKFAKVFFKRLKETFPKDEGLKSTQTINLIKSILNVNVKDPVAGVKLADLKRAINLFGPIRAQSSACVFVSQLHNIVKKSLCVRSPNRVKTSWFVGDMNRGVAEHVLLDDDCKDKTFLVRISSTNGENGDFVLSVRHGDHCHHLNIQGDPERAMSEIPYHAHLKFSGREFASLPDVVEYITNKQEIEIDNDYPSGDVSIYCRTVSCLHVYSKSPLNSTIMGYERTK